MYFFVFFYFFFLAFFCLFVGREGKKGKSHNFIFHFFFLLGSLSFMLEKPSSFSPHERLWLFNGDVFFKIPFLFMNINLMFFFSCSLQKQTLPFLSLSKKKGDSFFILPLRQKKICALFTIPRLHLEVPTKKGLSFLSISLSCFVFFFFFFFFFFCFFFSFFFFW